MAAYPTLPMLTDVTPLNDREIDISEAGGVRQVDLTAEQVYRIDIHHPLLTTAQVTTLLSSWSTNKGTVMTITASDGNSYDALWTQEPVVKQVNGTWRQAEVTLIGNRN